MSVAGADSLSRDDFESAYRLHHESVRRAAYAIGGAEDLDEIVQETFIKLWKSGGSFRGQSELKTWLYRVTINAAREHWRKRSRYRSAVLRYLEEPRPLSAEGGQAHWELSQNLARALEALSYEHREAVTLCYLEGLSLAEAAQVTETPEGTLKSRLFHARKALAEAMDMGRGKG